MSKSSVFLIFLYKNDLISLKINLAVLIQEKQNYNQNSWILNIFVTTKYEYQKLKVLVKKKLESQLRFRNVWKYQLLSQVFYLNYFLI